MSSSSACRATPAVLTPGASSRRALRPAARDEPLPAVDERLVAPDARAEIINGKVYFTPPADEHRATLHIDLAAVLRAHLASGYLGALGMLTRTSEKNDFATAASVFPEARDPETGGRKLEELAFEIASQQALGVPTKKARELIRRGVRRVVCLLVNPRRVLEWSCETESFMPLADSAYIEDPCFVRPLPVRALLDPAEVDGAILEALVARASPAITAIQAEGREQPFREEFEHGLAKGRREAILLVLRARSIPVDAKARGRIETCEDVTLLERWARRALEVKAIDEVFKASDAPLPARPVISASPARNVQ